MHEFQVWKHEFSEFQNSRQILEFEIFWRIWENQGSWGTLRDAQVKSGLIFSSAENSRAVLGRSSTEFAQATNFSSKLARLLSEVSFLVGEKSAVRLELYIHVNGVSNIGK